MAHAQAQFQQRLSQLAIHRQNSTVSSLTDQALIAFEIEHERVIHTFHICTLYIHKRKTLTTNRID